MGEQMSGAEVQAIYRRRYLETRRQNYVIQTEGFEAAWDAANIAERDAIMPVFEGTPKPDRLRRWVVKIMLGSAPTMEVLLKIAKSKSVPNYSRMTKFELEDALLACGVKL